MKFLKSVVEWLMIVFVDLDNMAYTRGSKDDWDRWAKIVGDEGFSWDRMFPFLLKVSCLFHLRRFFNPT